MIIDEADRAYCFHQLYHLRNSIVTLRLKTCAGVIVTVRGLEQVNNEKAIQASTLKMTLSQISEGLIPRILRSSFVSPIFRVDGFSTSTPINREDQSSSEA